MDDYIRLPEGTRVELIDGKFYDMAAPTTVHQGIGFEICYQLKNYVTENGGKCVPFIAPTDVQLDCDDKTMVQPDVLVVCDRSKITRERVVGAPDLVVEIVSPSNVITDVLIKLYKYKNAGVREYWIVFPDEKMVMVYNFEQGTSPVEYTFADSIPVGIWDGKCKIDFERIYDQIGFLY
jgi:Uma2 family endonuclease